VLLSVDDRCCEQRFDPKARPGADRTLVVRTASGVAGNVLVVAFAPPGGPVNGWVPTVVAVPRTWDNAPAVKLPWNARSAFDLYVLLLGPDAASADLLRLASRTPNGDPKIAAMQARQLEQAVQQWMAARSRAAFHGGKAGPAVGGLKRTALVDPNTWRQSADLVPLDARGAGAVVYRWRP